MSLRSIRVLGGVKTTVFRYVKRLSHHQKSVGLKHFRGLALLSCIGVLVGGCVEDDASPEKQADQPLMLNFKGLIGSEDFLCGKTYENIGIGKHDYRAEGLRMYVSRLRALLDNGTEVTASLSEDGVWQHDNVALLDFGADCDRGDEHPLNTAVDANVLLYSTRRVTGVCFDVGIPFDRNHQRAEGALPPLDTTALFNSVQNGRTFLRLDGTANPEDKPQTFNVQLKSTGCLSEAKNRRPSVACGNPNIAQVCLDLDPQTQAIAFDIKSLLAGADVSKNKDAELGCYSAKNDSECTTIVPALGISFEFIAPEEEATSFVPQMQTVFKVVNMN